MNVYLCRIGGDDWIVYCVYIMLVYGFGRVPMTVYVVTLWTNACTCAYTCTGLDRSTVLLLVIYMHVLVLMFV